MTWKEAKQKIKKHVGVCKDVNTKRSKKSDYRYVKDVPPPHFRVQIGKDNYVNITWTMLEKCWRVLNRTGIYDYKVFEELFPEKMSRRCHIHVVGKIFEKAGLVDSVCDDYYVLKQTPQDKDA
ncbi:MAG: hypothetical protein ABII79_04865 [bacterium]